MEPTQAAITFVSRVIAVEEKFVKSWLDGIGDQAHFKDESRGWFIGLEGSYEFLYIGNEKPNIKVGDIATVRITFG